ncbi:MAG: DUF2272 domain-containing protein [Planctomycetes bacterium]|nr:DUF2272 domain-containing protein [Planctomycetota bacterium]
MAFRHHGFICTSRPVCFTTRDGHRVCGPRDYVEMHVRDRILSDGDPDSWARTLDPFERQLVEETRDAMWHEAMRSAHAQVANLRREIVRIAREEYDNWHPTGQQGLHERRDAEGRRLVQLYWQRGVGRTVSDASLSSATWQDSNPWSSAFVSYVVREAGGGNHFQYAWGHAVYARAAIDAREHDSPRIFRGYRPHERVLQLGDIVVKARAGSGATYTTVRRGMKTHGDIVTEIHADHVVAIGGNVNQNVDSKNLSIDATGHLTAAGYFVVIQLDPVVPARL